MPNHSNIAFNIRDMVRKQHENKHINCIRIPDICTNNDVIQKLQHLELSEKNSQLIPTLLCGLTDSVRRNVEIRLYIA